MISIHTFFLISQLLIFGRSDPFGRIDTPTDALTSIPGVTNLHMASTSSFTAATPPSISVSTSNDQSIGQSISEDAQDSLKSPSQKVDTTYFAVKEFADGFVSTLIQATFGSDGNQSISNANKSDIIDRPMADQDDQLSISDQSEQGQATVRPLGDQSSISGSPDEPMGNDHSDQSPIDHRSSNRSAPHIDPPDQKDVMVYRHQDYFAAIIYTAFIFGLAFLVALAVMGLCYLGRQRNRYPSIMPSTHNDQPLAIDSASRPLTPVGTASLISISSSHKSGSSSRMTMIHVDSMANRLSMHLRFQEALSQESLLSTLSTMPDPAALISASGSEEWLYIGPRPEDNGNMVSCNF